MALPIVKMTLPSVLDDQPNGQLPASLLTTIRMPGGGTAVVLAQAAPKWNALLADAAAAGFPFTHNGDYRPLAEQIALLKDRYVVVASGGSITWDGRQWRKKDGEATVATPGRSNHGWGLALDLAVLLNGRVVSLASTAGAAALAWLKANAARYGISAEIQSEAWHWRPHDGDAMTPAVARFAASSTEEEDMGLVVRDSDHPENCYVLGPDGIPRLITCDINSFGYVASGRWNSPTGDPRSYGLPYANKPINQEPWIDIPKVELRSLAVDPGPVGTVDLAPVLARIDALAEAVAKVSAPALTGSGEFTIRFPTDGK